jgi:carboxymethylenebutenolidase|tara:strand:+ start:693 stop:1721 length:1029 start_codon:yes stop_codon:yes gene_type:complete
MKEDGVDPVFDSPFDSVSDPVTDPATDPYSTMKSVELLNHGISARVFPGRRGAVCLSVAIVLLVACGCMDPAVETPVETSSRSATPIIGPPPSEAGAAQALSASPRQGEWVDVELEGSDRPVGTWIVRPEGGGDVPVVLVIHEIFGLTDWVRAVADRLAENGFVAVVPDLLSGLGPDGGGTASVASRDEVVRLIRSLDPVDAIARLDAVRDHAATLPATTGPVAVLGFSWGGSTGFAYAVTQPRLQAAVVYYGSSPVDTADFHLVQAPVLGLYGGDDERVNATIPIAEREMARYGKHFETEIFAGAGHGFLRAQEGRDGANEAASLLAWRRTIEFLRRHLAG